MSLVQLDDYGPWTVTPKPRSETDLQAFQSRLFADLADFVGSRDGYAFFGRFDNMIAVTNGIDPETHERFQERVRNRYPVTASVGIGRAPTPAAALGAASEALQSAGGAQDPARESAIAVAGPDRSSGHVTIAHFDVVDATGTYTNTHNAVDTNLTIQRATTELASYLRSEHDGVTQFVGGDNVVAACPPLDEAQFDEALSHVEAIAGVTLQVGVGAGSTARDAGQEAKEALERCRETGTRFARGD
ncbi:GTP cyclohydrolase IIa [Halomicrobium sp. HM KBTZ05]|uniref:GTP cyclohydrolase III n=1 Tax=Halomicrobium mukohataei TaxID=57705 RepID=A0A847UDI2_9EURY|nr:GTP cyclohydrolase IIa [Halomicrobium mukohataei]NLV09550.1 GTP cyclohydrolase IIa [Halomicrobium mukohataei]